MTEIILKLVNRRCVLPMFTLNTKAIRISNRLKKSIVHGQDEARDL